MVLKNVDDVSIASGKLLDGIWVFLGHQLQLLVVAMSIGLVQLSLLVKSKLGKDKGIGVFIIASVLQLTNGRWFAFEQKVRKLCILGVLNLQHLPCGFQQSGAQSSGLHQLIGIDSYLLDSFTLALGFQNEDLLVAQLVCGVVE